MSNEAYIEQPGVGIIYTVNMRRPAELTEGSKYDIRMRKEMINVFDRMDLDGSGNLDLDEIIKAREKQLKELSGVLAAFCVTGLVPGIVAASVKVDRYRKELQQLKEIRAQELQTQELQVQEQQATKMDVE